ncbi:unnamed protein product [Amoebophrya sp. A25]|nr:unnamed protein product [Amoebophrya sp. A25]|eukprot:GSA25T00004447001.1
MLPGEQQQQQPPSAAGRRFVLAPTGSASLADIWREVHLSVHSFLKTLHRFIGTLALASGVLCANGQSTKFRSRKALDSSIVSPYCGKYLSTNVSMEAMDGRPVGYSGDGLLLEAYSTIHQSLTDYGASMAPHEYESKKDLELHALLWSLYRSLRRWMRAWQVVGVAAVSSETALSSAAHFANVRERLQEAEALATSSSSSNAVARISDSPSPYQEDRVQIGVSNAKAAAELRRKTLYDNAVKMITGATSSLHSLLVGDLQRRLGHDNGESAQTTDVMRSYTAFRELLDADQITAVLADVVNARSTFNDNAGLSLIGLPRNRLEMQLLGLGEKSSTAEGTTVAAARLESWHELRKTRGEFATKNRVLENDIATMRDALLTAESEVTRLQEEVSIAQDQASRVHIIPGDPEYLQKPSERKDDASKNRVLAAARSNKGTHKSTSKTSVAGGCSTNLDSSTGDAAVEQQLSNRELLVEQLEGALEWADKQKGDLEREKLKYLAQIQDLTEARATMAEIIERKVGECEEARSRDMELKRSYEEQISLLSEHTCKIEMRLKTVERAASRCRVRCGNCGSWDKLPLLSNMNDEQQEEIQIYCAVCRSLLFVIAA